MNPETAPITREALLEVVGSYLREAFANSVPEVLTAAVHSDDDWWTVPVVSTLGEADRFNYYGKLAELETAIRKAEGIEVMFVPASPVV